MFWTNISGKQIEITLYYCAIVNLKTYRLFLKTRTTKKRGGGWGTKSPECGCSGAFFPEQLTNCILNSI